MMVIEGGTNFGHPSIVDGVDPKVNLTVPHQIAIDPALFKYAESISCRMRTVGPTANRRLKRGGAVDRTPLSKDVLHYNAVRYWMMKFATTFKRWPEHRVAILMTTA
jgi:hypothetical protein